MEENSHTKLPYRISTVHLGNAGRQCSNESRKLNPRKQNHRPWYEVPEYEVEEIIDYIL